jgi:hypothetical protein
VIFYRDVVGGRMSAAGIAGGALMRIETPPY